MGIAKRIGQLAGKVTDAYVDYGYVKPAKAGIGAAKFGVETAADLGEGFSEGFTGQLPPPPLPGQTPFSESEHLPKLAPPVWPKEENEIKLPQKKDLPSAPLYGDPSYFPGTLTPDEERTVSGELVAGPASMGRLPPTPLKAIQNPSITAARPPPPLPPPRPSLPVVEGTTMRRVESGRGNYGENLDLTPQNFTRQDPMSLDQAFSKGLIVPSTPKPFFRQYGNAPKGPNAGMGMTGDDERAAMDTATRGERWGSGGSTTRRQGRASAIIDTIRANRDAKKQSDIRINEALRTPQMQTGAYVGQTWIPDGRGGGRVESVDTTTGGGNRSPKPMTAAQATNVLKQAALLRAGDKLKMIEPDPETADAMENVLRQQGYDVDALKGGRPTAGGQQAGVQASTPQVHKDGMIGQRNGKNYIRKNGHWYPVN